MVSGQCKWNGVAVDWIILTASQISLHTNHMAISHLEEHFHHAEEFWHLVQRSGLGQTEGETAIGELVSSCVGALRQWKIRQLLGWVGPYGCTWYP